MTSGDGSGEVPARRHANPDGEIGGWVAETAEVSNSVFVGWDAAVFGNAQIAGNVEIKNNARVYGNAHLGDNAKLYGDARVHGNARLSERARFLATRRSTAMPPLAVTD